MIPKNSDTEHISLFLWYNADMNLKNESCGGTDNGNQTRIE